MEDEAVPLARRDLLKRGVLAGLSGSAILSLAPEEARAHGSWRKVQRGSNACLPSGSSGYTMQGAHFGYPGTQGSSGAFESGESSSLLSGKSHGWADDSPSTSGWIVPGSYQWRLRREAVAAERDRVRGEWKRFAHDD
jgi:hypothetical protein